MSHSKATGGATSSPYENNVRFDDETSELLSQLKGGLSDRLSYDNSAYKSNQDILKSLSTGTYNYKENPYVQQSADAIQAANYNDYQRDLASSLSSMQGYGRGATINRLADTYNNYKLNTDKAIAEMKLNEYNNALNTALTAVDKANSSDVFNTAGNMLTSLANVVKETYGIQPVQTSERSGSGLKN